MADTVPTLSAAGSQAQKTTGKTLKKTAKAKPKAAVKPTGIPTSGARLAEWLANPGLRSRLPDSALTADLLKTRQTNAYNSAPAAPGSSYTNSELSKLVGMLTQQKYGAAETALGQQGQALDRRAGTEIPAWFQTYRDQVAGAKQAQAAGAAAQVGSLNQMAAQAAGDTGQLAGAPMDAEGAARAQAAAQIRSAGVSNQAALAQNLGGNQDAFLQNLGLLSQGQQQAALLGVGQQKNDLASQIAQLALDKGDFGTTQRQTILSDEADSALKAALTQAQIGTQTAGAAATKASTTKTKAETTKTKAEQAYFDKHGYYPSTGKPATKSPDVITSGAFAGYTKTQVAKMSPDKKTQLTTDYKKNGGKGKAAGGYLPKSQENTSLGHFGEAISYFQRYKGKADPKVVSQYLATGATSGKTKFPKIDQRLVEVARSYVANGNALTQKDVDALHKMGLHIRGQYKIKKLTKKSVGQDVAEAVQTGVGSVGAAVGSLGQ